MRIIVIIADGLQVAALGPYGNDWIDAPSLNRLATQAVVFDQHFADFPGTVDPRWGDHLIELHNFSLMPPWEPPVELLSEQFEDWEFDADPDEDVLNPQPGFLDPNDDRALDQLRRVYGIEVKLFDIRLAEEMDWQRKK